MRKKIKLLEEENCDMRKRMLLLEEKKMLPEKKREGGSLRFGGDRCEFSLPFYTLPLLTLFCLAAKFIWSCW